MRNVAARACRRRARCIRESALSRQWREANRADANQDLRFQKDGAARVSGARGCRGKSRQGLGGMASVPSRNLDETRLCIAPAWRAELVPPPACQPSAAKKERAQEMERTSRSYIAR